ncbi:MAG: carbon monoxide dehydrogenase accessory protein CooC [Thermodesulfovibrionales bacterium]|nr:carbon monoxide dehydrogenase accessory protein CooC [Thermodesulfovibrionales bacterium]
MKIAITGKGGVGKTTLAAILSYLFASEGKRVIAVDADPGANLAQALGIKPSEIEKIRPLAEMSDLIEERTGVKPGTVGGIFRLNPKVDDIPEGIGYKFDGITLLVMGKAKVAASGCYCPESSLLRRLLKHLVVERDEVVILDMEAGIEHLTRGTAEGVDAFIVVVEPGQRSIQTANTVRELAKGLGVKDVFVVANKVRNDADVTFLRNNLKEMNILGALKFNQSVMDADIGGISPYERSPEMVNEVRAIKEKLQNLIK